MRLVYRCFGTVAFLAPDAQVRKEGMITVEANVADGSVLSLYSVSRKEKRDFLFENGRTSVPADVFEGGCEVQIYFDEKTAPAIATPIREMPVGDVPYLVGGSFGTQEELARICQAIGYVGDLVQISLAEAAKIAPLQKDVEALRKRANSGDIFNF